MKRIERGKKEKLCYKLCIGQQSDGTVAGVVAAPLPGSLHTLTHTGSNAPESDSYTLCPFNHRLQLLLKAQDAFGQHLLKQL